MRERARLVCDEDDDAATDLGVELASRIRRGREVFDWEFDRIYAPPMRVVSSAFWTPVSVALRATALLVNDRSTRVLDVGSGVGKFCLVGAAASGATFTGVEHREHLVGAARQSARRLELEHAQFVHGTFDQLDARSYDAFYFFNPFEEGLWGTDSRLDDTVELSEERYCGDVERAERFLAEARVGTRVVVYNGFGGTMPSSYRLVLREARQFTHLELWIQAESTLRRLSPRRAPRRG